MNIRATAAQVIHQVVDEGQSLSAVLPQAQSQIRERDHALLQEICYGVLRWLPRLESITKELMDKPLKGKQRVVHHLILVGLYQLSFMRIPAHAAVAETVNATKDLKKMPMRGLVNAILRQYQRQQDELDTKAQSHKTGRVGHPNWLINAIEGAYPDQAEAIFAANNTKAPMWLRVNHKHHTAEAYQALLTEQGIESELHPEAKDALKLAKPCDVYQLPGFDEGWVSVQDAAAQLSINYLNPQPNERILDCCAAPGGKTAHILEREPSAQVIAIDFDPQRLKRVEENLARLQLTADVRCGDARYPAQWYQGEQFDRILLDAPCSATGVIRRHPDIKWLRRANDIEALAALQSEIFDAMWQQLKVGGTLVFATCSIMPQENVEQVRAFLARTENAELITGTLDQPGRQILPGENDMDGFFYATLKKN